MSVPHIAWNVKRTATAHFLAHMAEEVCKLQFASAIQSWDTAWRRKCWAGMRDSATREGYAERHIRALGFVYQQTSDFERQCLLSSAEFFFRASTQFGVLVMATPTVDNDGTGRNALNLLTGTTDAAAHSDSGGYSSEREKTSPVWVLMEKVYKPEHPDRKKGKVLA